MKITIDGTTLEGTPEELKEMMALMGTEFPGDVEEKEIPEFSEGDLVKALADGDYGDIKAGVIGTIDWIGEYIDEEDPYAIRVATRGKYDYFRPQDIELVTEEEKSYKPSEGDIVKVSVKGEPRYNWGNVTNGEVGVITRVETDDDIFVDFPSQIGWRAMATELVLATDEEKAEYENAGKFAKLGRKPGEFKKGDIVRVTKSPGAQPNGTIFEVSEIDELGRAVDGRGYVYSGHKNHIELIAPVESRVDNVSE